MYAVVAGAEPQVLSAPVRVDVPVELHDRPNGTHGIPSGQHAAALRGLPNVFQVSVARTPANSITAHGGPELIASLKFL